AALGPSPLDGGADLRSGFSRALDAGHVRRRRHPPLRHRVMDVLLLRSDEQMLEVDAPWLVAGVADALIGAEGAMFSNPPLPHRTPGHEDAVAHVVKTEYHRRRCT